MFKIGSEIRLSASDLVGHLACRHLTGLDLAVAKGQLAKPKVWDPLLELLAMRGDLHEQGYIEHLKASGHAVTVISEAGAMPARHRKHWKQ
jgi:hypothetical protein